MSPARVAVVGAGITGLTLAWTLQEDATRRGVPISLAVLDAAPQVGGHAQTAMHDGFLVEAGPNGFLNREPQTLALIESLGLGDRLVTARPAAKRRFVLRDGRLWQVPSSPVGLFTTGLLSRRGALRVLREPFVAAAPADADETVFAFAARRLGHEAAEVLVDTAVSGISAGDSRQLSVGAQFPILPEMERDHGSLTRAMFARRGQRSGPSALLSFDQGLGTLTAALRARLGADVRTAAAVEAIERGPMGWLVQISGQPPIEVDHVVLAAPARTVAPVVAGLDAGLASLLRDIAYAGLAVVALGYRVDDVRRPLDGYGYLVTRTEGLATLGVVWESSLFAGRAPAGHVLLRVMLGGVRRPGLASQSDDALAQIARRELSGPLGVDRAPRFVSVTRWPHAIAQYTVGHRGRITAIRDRVAGHPGLTVCGTSYDGVSFNHAVTSGRTAAHALAAHLWDEPRPAVHAAVAATVSV